MKRILLAAPLCVDERSKEVEDPIEYGLVTIDTGELGALMSLADRLLDLGQLLRGNARQYLDDLEHGRFTQFTINFTLPSLGGACPKMRFVSLPSAAPVVLGEFLETYRKQIVDDSQWVWVNPALGSTESRYFDVLCAWIDDGAKIDKYNNDIDDHQLLTFGRWNAPRFGWATWIDELSGSEIETAEMPYSLEDLDQMLCG